MDQNWGQQALPFTSSHWVPRPHSKPPPTPGAPACGAGRSAILSHRRLRHNPVFPFQSLLPI